MAYEFLMGDSAAHVEEESICTTTGRVIECVLKVRESSPTSAWAGMDMGETVRLRIADLGGERKQHQHNMLIATTPHPDAPACDEVLATAKAIKGRREDTMQTSRMQKHQRLLTLPSLLQVSHTHLHSHSDLQPQLYQHHVHLTYTHGIEMPSGFWNEFTHPILPHPHS